MSESFAPDFPNLRNLPDLKYKKAISNKFSPKLHTAISHTNNIEKSQLNKQQNNFDLTKIFSNQYPILNHNYPGI